MNGRLLPRLALGCLALLLAAAARGQAVQFTSEPAGLVTGALPVTVAAPEPAVARLELYVNGVRKSAAAGRELTATLNAGLYVRRLRLRAVGYDASGAVVGEDEIVVNDPRPPFRVRLQAPPAWPQSGEVRLHAEVTHPAEVHVAGVDFFVGEAPVGSDPAAPYSATVDAGRLPGALYARVVARAGDREAHDVRFFGEDPHGEADVLLQQIPVSVVGGADRPLTLEVLRVEAGGEPLAVEGLLPAADQPLHLILLVDCSESMFEELPVVRAAALRLAREVLRPGDRMAVVAFNERTYWLTAGYTDDQGQLAAAVDRLRTGGPTHLYDSVVEMLYEVQKTPGRQALVVLTDGADQGSRFELDHLVHYARYAGVPIYPVIKNRSLARWMKLGVGRLQARRIANLAEDTGATYFLVEREDQLGEVYATIAAELRQQYRLVFHSAADVPDRWRPLAVESTAGHRLRVPRGFFP